MMGQAKQRGNYEVRKEQAIERDKIKELNDVRSRKVRPMGKSRLNMLLASAIAIGASTK